MKNHVFRTLLLTATMGLVAGALGSTIENVKIAYKGETTAEARYTAFARQADQEGFKNVASLFRGVARAEKIHASNFKQMLIAHKDVPEVGKFDGTVGSTKENLELAIRDETIERDRLYPPMLAEAKADKNHHAVRAFIYAINAEGSHAELFKEALKQVEEGKKGPAEAIYVCPKCGETFRAEAPNECPVCTTPNERFLKVTEEEGTR